MKSWPRPAARKDYQDFARALFAFQEARSLWSGNDRAKAGEIEAQLAYAATALEKEDFDLGVSLLDERIPQQAALEGRLVAAQRERNARQARIKGLRRTALALAALIFLLLSGGFLFIGRQYRQIDHSNQELNKTIDELNVARSGTLEKTRRGTVETANGELTKTQSRLMSSNVALVAAQKNGGLRGRNGPAWKSKMPPPRPIGRRSAWRPSGSTTIRSAMRAACWTTIRRRSGRSFRHWEWGHLKWLCDRQAGELLVGPRIEALARSGDGKLLAIGTASGQALVFQVDWPANSLQKIGEVTFGGPDRGHRGIARRRSSGGRRRIRQGGYFVLPPRRQWLQPRTAAARLAIRPAF